MHASYLWPCLVFNKSKSHKADSFWSKFTGISWVMSDINLVHRVKIFSESIKRKETTSQKCMCVCGGRGEERIGIVLLCTSFFVAPLKLHTRNLLTAFVLWEIKLWFHCYMRWFGELLFNYGDYTHTRHCIRKHIHTIC